MTRSASPLCAMVLTLFLPPIVLGDAPAKERKQDRAAMEKRLSAFVQALLDGDAEKAASFWTNEGQYASGDGETVVGRKSIEAAYKKVLKKGVKSKAKIEIETKAIQFLASNAAIHRGTFRAKAGSEPTPPGSEFSILYAKEDGVWHFAVFRETPAAHTLNDLAWLIGGTWTLKIKETVMTIKYTWAENKQFIRTTFKTTIGDGPAVTATQYIGNDPQTGGLRSWVFDSSGGHGQAVWTWDKGGWVISSTGTHSDGSVVVATNLFKPQGKNEILWKSVNRSLDGEKLPDIEEVKITRTQSGK